MQKPPSEGEFSLFSPLTQRWEIMGCNMSNKAHKRLLLVIVPSTSVSVWLHLTLLLISVSKL